MEGLKEFQGRDLDDAIRQACDYFDVAREKLEIDIVQDSKSGIFGIVGARKALIKARRMQMRGPLDATLERDSQSPARQDAAETAPETTGRNKGRPRQEGKAAPAKKTAPAKKPESAPPSSSVEEDEEGESQTLFLDKLPEAPAYSDFPLETRPASRKPGQGTPRGRPAAAKHRERPAGNQVKHGNQAGQELFSGKDLVDEGDTDGLAELPFEELDLERLKSLTLETVQRLVTPVVGEAGYELHLADSRVHVGIDCGEDSGVLIGREGQTLAALQYLASRIVSRGMNAAVRINLDAGDYRQRQDNRLRELALHLAAKVKHTGRPCSTRPLSSYHRRIIHVTLQEDEQVQTRSTGEGPLKRVVVQRKS
ncbi:MAG: Jag N-terminal domain-containing protein [Deltaproteobacteria bacterium]|jgi:spoIIIJ-associated protein|nr:Jag N-terminal domain-containing protein [Deltaproteobacteria bacterium]